MMNRAADRSPKVGKEVVLNAVGTKIIDSLGFHSGAFKPNATQTEAHTIMNKTAKSLFNETKKRKETPGENERRADKGGDSGESDHEKTGPLYIPPIPGVNTSSFLGVDRERVVATIVSLKFLI
jgi:hypothetical protein